VRSGVPVTSLGHFDPATGKVFDHPRQRLDQGVGGRSGVRITNPAASEASVSRRTASLGMGGVGQRGRGQDF
jgi:hypothetical protein